MGSPPFQAEAVATQWAEPQSGACVESSQHIWADVAALVGCPYCPGDEKCLIYVSLGAESYSSRCDAQCRPLQSKALRRAWMEPYLSLV